MTRLDIPHATEASPRGHDRATTGLPLTDPMTLVTGPLFLPRPSVPPVTLKSEYDAPPTTSTGTVLRMTPNANS